MAVAITRTSDPASAATTAGNVVVYTATAGAAATDRLLILPIGMENATPAVVNRVTIDTGAGAVDMDRAGAPATLASMGAWVYWKLVPTGTAATISITWSAAVLAAENHVCLYAVTGANTGGLVSYTSNTSTDMDSTVPLTASITVPASGGAIAIAACASTTAGSHTWANMTADLDDGTANFRFVTSTRTTAASVTATLTGALNGEDGALAVIVLGPTPTALAGLGFKYPLPILVPHPVSLRTWLEGTTAFMADSTRMPARVTDWGMNVPPIYVAPSHPKQFIPQVDSPFSQESWPNPILPVYAVPPHPRQFIPQPTNNPFNQFDWPVPQPPRYPISLRTWLGSTTALLGPQVDTANMPGRVTDWGLQPAPFQRPPTGKFWTQHPQITPNPFSQTSWPNPVLRTWQPPPPPLQFNPATPPMPFNLDDWPVPQRPTYPLQQNPMQLRPTTATAQEFMPSRVTDWGAQAIPPPRSDWLAQLNVGLRATAPRTGPFNQFDWPLPKYPHLLRRYDWLAQLNAPLLSLTYVPREATFQAQYVKPTINLNWLPQSNLALLTAAPAVTYIPARVTDWGAPPVPVVLAQKSAPSNIAVLTAVAAPPFKQTDWPLAIRTPPIGQFWTARPQIAANPFSQQNWPNPIPPLNFISQRTWTNGTTQFFVTVPTPFSQTSWPNPIQPINITSQRTWISSTIGLLNQLRVGPFNQFDWPLPIPPQYPTSGKTWVGSTIGLRTQVRTGPFNQFSWPVPTRPGQPGSVYFFKNSPIVITPAPVVEVTIDTHDGVFDERKWREYQERLRRQREKVHQQEKERRARLRAQLVKLYRGIEDVPVEATPPELPESKRVPLPPEVLDFIVGMYANPRVRDKVEEYSRLLFAEQMRREQEDEDELETILMATLL